MLDRLLPDLTSQVQLQAMSYLDKLCARVCAALGPPPAEASLRGVASLSAIASADLTSLYRSCDGATGFEEALVILPLGLGNSRWPTIDRFNAPDGWRADLSTIGEGHVFFAVDAFGGLFSRTNAGVHSFDVETGEAKWLGPDLEAWADVLLTKWDYFTGYSLMHAWQVKHGRLLPPRRLMSKTPFVLGGEFDLENLVPLGLRALLRAKARLAVRISALPDGAKITLDRDWFELSDGVGQDF